MNFSTKGYFFRAFLNPIAASNPMIGMIVNNVNKFWYSITVGSFPSIYPTNKDIKISGVNPTTEIIPNSVPVN